MTKPPTAVPARQLAIVAGAPVHFPDPDRLTHLQLRRFAGCPVCNLHLRTMMRRHAEIEAAGIGEVVVFHSPASELAEYAGDLPFPLVADPDKRLYAEFGVEAGKRALLHPAAWLPTLRGVARSTWAVLRGRERMPALLRPSGGSFGLPGDFLIAPDGRVLAVKYGEHAYDQWSVDELLDIAAARLAAPVT